MKDMKFAQLQDLCQISASSNEKFAAAEIAGQHIECRTSASLTARGERRSVPRQTFMLNGTRASYKDVLESIGVETSKA